MTILKELIPMSMPEQVNGSTSLESLKSIVGKLPPELEQYEPYLSAVAYYREIWSTTGAYPVDEARRSLDELRGDTSQEVIRKLLNRQLNAICKAFPVPDLTTKIKPESLEKARVVHSKVELDEAQESYLRKQ